MSPSIAAIIASVAPQVTVTWVSGSIAQPGWNRVVLAAIASRSGFAPQVIAYWLMSAWIASAAAALSSAGHGEVGEALGQVDGAGVDGQPGHLADDRFGEAGGACGDDGHRDSVARLPAV